MCLFQVYSCTSSAGNSTWASNSPTCKPKAYRKNKIKLIGIRKDGRFIYEDEKGEKKQLSDYDEKHYILYDESNEQYKEEAEILYNEMEALRFKINLVLDKITGIELIEYKKQLLGN